MGSIASGFMSIGRKPKMPAVAPITPAKPAVLSAEEKAATEKTKAADIEAEQQRVRKKLFEQSGRSSTNITGGLSAKTYLGS